MALPLERAAFKEGDPIPHRYTCMGKDLSPPLHWSMPPVATKSFVMIVDDSDAPVGAWVHWVIHDIPLDLRGLTEGAPAEDQLPNEAVQDLNDFKRIGYGGPCPTPGKPHRYYFKRYAPDTILDLTLRATKAQVLAACQGQVLAEAQLMGRFARWSPRDVILVSVDSDMVQRP